jgi:hypothetical protein
MSPFRFISLKCHNARTKLFATSPTSSATTVMTGMSFASTQPALHGKPPLPPPLSIHHQNTRLPKPKDSMPLNRFSEQTPTVLFSSSSNTLISGKCSKKQKPHSGPPRRSTSRPILRIRIASPTTNTTSYPMCLPSSLHRMASSTRT